VDCSAGLTDPDIGKPLKDEHKGLNSYRVGRFRIIYRLSSKGTIEIVAIGPRRIIYELTYRLVRKEKRETCRLCQPSRTRRRTTTRRSG
jgi:hypothetical protein